MSADQFEPNIPLEDQAFYHDLDFALVNYELALGYALTHWVTLEMVVPYRSAYIEARFLNEADEVLPDFESIHHRDEVIQGMGDVAFGARFSLLPPGSVEGLMLLVSAGFTAPTGSTRPNPFELGRQGKRHQHIFFGTGTVDPYMALMAAYRMTWVRLTGFVHGRGALYANDYGYRGTANIYAGVNVGSDFGLEVVDAQLGLHLMKEFPATWGDENAENSGRTDLMVALGLGWQIAESWRVNGGVKIPVWTEAIGGQLDIPVIVDLSIQATTKLTN